jgi:hypothetical protein
MNKFGLLINELLIKKFKIMKSEIRENKKNNLQSLSKKLLMVLAIALGTTVMVNAQTTPAKTTPAKETKTTKKEHKKESKKVETSKTAAPEKTTTAKK